MVQIGGNILTRGRAMSAGNGNGARARSNGNGNVRAAAVQALILQLNNLTNAERQAVRQSGVADAFFGAVALKDDKFGDKVSDLNTLLDEPLWSRVEIDADGATASPTTIDFFLGAGDGIDQSRFVNDRKLDGTMDFKILAVALAIQARAGQANFDSLQFNGALFGDLATQTQFNFPLEAGIMQSTERAAFALDGEAAPRTVESVTGLNIYGWELSGDRDLKWPANTNMIWNLRTALPQTFATPPDGVDDFTATLLLYGYKVQSIVG